MTLSPNSPLIQLSAPSEPIMLRHIVHCRHCGWQGEVVVEKREKRGISGESVDWSLAWHCPQCERGYLTLTRQSDCSALIAELWGQAND
ncbi:hypothetical protein FJY94_04855 [Candidatus Kaiserbacteria bacterium]|nr:hypothetical protein [Candidatus Kaiserbacteria bacterium]